MVTYAEERSCTTQFELGELFHKGNRQQRDYEQAFKWYLNAARNGSRQAQHRLGMLYARGQGVEQSYARSYAWCKVAAFQQSRRARRKLKLIRLRMSWEQIRRGNWLAQELYDCYVASSRSATAGLEAAPQASARQAPGRDLR